jgi:hypothetical protein
VSNTKNNRKSLLRVAEGIGPAKPGNLGAISIKGAKSYRVDF